MLDTVRTHEKEAPRIKYRVKLTEPIGTAPTYFWVTDKIEVMVFRDGEIVRVISSLCPHMGARLNWTPSKGAVACPWHGLEFKKETLKSCHHRYRTLKEYKADLTGEDLVIYE